MNTKVIYSRPMPPSAVRFEDSSEMLVPAPELESWLRCAFIADGAPLWNEEHQHLNAARLGCLWTNIRNARQMNTVAGETEMPSVQGGKWKRGRHDQQIRGWFGDDVDFLITFFAPYAADCCDLSFCALAEHELYHCGQARDPFGAPKFLKSGAPVFAMRGHDVEEFVGVVERYGAGAAAGKTRALVEAANRAPLFGEASVACVCGTCGASI